jgi:hypothetical protein
VRCRKRIAGGGTGRGRCELAKRRGVARGGDDRRITDQDIPGCFFRHHFPCFPVILCTAMALFNAIRVAAPGGPSVLAVARMPILAPAKNVRVQLIPLGTALHMVAFPRRVRRKQHPTAIRLPRARSARSFTRRVVCGCLHLPVQEILIRVRAIGINPVEAYVRAGELRGVPAWLSGRFPPRHTAIGWPLDVSLPLQCAGALLQACPASLPPGSLTRRGTTARALWKPLGRARSRL